MSVINQELSSVIYQRFQGRVLYSQQLSVINKMTSCPLTGSFYRKSLLHVMWFEMDPVVERPM